jgi:FkbM family methyltransferase
MRYTNFLGKKLFLHPEGNVVCDNIANQQPCEEHLVYFFDQYIKPDFIIVEGGAYVGIHTVRFSQLASEGHVYSFEASKRNYNIINTTIIENNITNVTLLNKALYSDNSTVYLNESWTPDQDFIGGTISNNSVEAVTIDSLNLSRVNFIKLDVEGGELNAFKGALNTLNKHKPIIAFEYLNKPNIQSPIPFLTENGYEVFNIEGHWDYIALPKQ